MYRLTFSLCMAVYAAFPPFAATAQSVPAAEGRSAPSTPTPSSSGNESRLPWVRFSAEERLRLEGFSGGNFQADSSDAYVLNRLRFNMALSPASWLRFHFQMQDSRVEGKDQKPYAPPFQDTFDLRIAYAEFGDSEQKHVSLRVGRQEINLGEERLVGSSGWTNTARSFDAARLSLHQGRFNLDAFAASPVVLHDGDVGDHVPGNNLHGLYGGLENVVPGSKIEPYLFWRLSQRQKTETGTIGDLDFTTVGVRWLGKLPHRFDYSLDMARQQGSLGTDRIDAWAGHWNVGYTLARTWKPRLLTEFNYASGDGNAKDGRRHTFDQLFPSGHEKYGLGDQVGWRNILHGRTGVELKPAPKWMAVAKFGGYWLADAHDALYNAAGAAVVRNANGSAGRFVGTEIDASVNYVFSKRVQIGGGFAHLFTGAFLNRTTPGKSYNYPYLMLTGTL
jgi:alginate export protein